ncbi:MAG: hypothetical protein H6945_13825 [Zoogloeaceae bacterium]|nr:hypothetical protein [Rhodocyclaceae bacterium]MCP5236807.1 hypothetical protein [Zoogloeaceae bacterium]
MAGSLWLRLLVFPVCSYVFFYGLFALRAPNPSFVFGKTEALWAALIAGSFAWLALNKWIVIRRIRSELDMAGRFELADGKRAVVSGRVRAVGSPLESPCAGARCIAYRYKVVHRASTGTLGDSAGSHMMTDYRGYAMTPSVVRGATRSVSILAETDNIEFLILKPGLDALDGEEIKGEAARERIRRYLGAINFGDECNDRMNAGRQARTKAAYVAPGDFRTDTCAMDAGPVSEDNHLFETVIAEGEPFLVSGIYDADRNGIGPGANSTLEPLRLIRGGNAAHKADLAGKRKTITVAWGLALLTSAVYFMNFV